MTVVGILEHLPTEATLVQTEKNRERQQWYRERERAHAAGDHSLRVPRGGGGHWEPGRGSPPRSCSLRQHVTQLKYWLPVGK